MFYSGVKPAKFAQVGLEILVNSSWQGVLRNGFHLEEECAYWG